ncbi:UNVERIFIED_CONTAM: hypothetical protein HDU68_008260 [Siphonaria sp. JEL0065]|nr:hypothetical protein HDU68_008260 [Siphonaria sp. JEL0065]
MSKRKADTLLDNLIEWATSNGADIKNLAIEEREGLRGAVAIKEIPAGSTIGFLPPSLILSESTGASTPFGTMLSTYMDSHPQETEAVTGSTDLYAKASIQFAAFIAHEQQYNTKTFWKPYFDTLPLDFGLPLQWPVDDVALFLDGTNLEFMAKERRRMLEDAVILIRNAASSSPEFKHCSSTFSFDSLAWAYSAIISRAFPKGKSIIVDGSLDTSSAASGISSDESRREKGFGQNDPKALFELCLYPVLDMINHKRGQEIEWNSEKVPGITFISPLGVATGQVVWNNYGSKGNENLLSNYGFILSPNPEDYAKIALNISPQDPLHEYRKSILNLHRNISTVHLFFGDDVKVSEELMTATRILVGSEREVESVVASIVGDVSVGNAKLDLVALSTLYALVTDKLQKLEVRKRALKEFVCTSDAQKERLSMANVYREGQIKIFSHALTLFQAKFSHILSNNTEECSSSFILTLRNSRQSGLVLEAIAQDLSPIDEQGILDQDTILALVLMHEEFLGPESGFYGFFESKSGKRSVEEAAALMGDQAQEMSQFYTEALSGFLSESPFFVSLDEESFTAERFVWANSFLETNGITLRGSVLRGMGLLDLFSDDEDEEEEEDVFGIVMM